MAFLIALCGGIIMNKTKRMLKNAAISVGIGAVPAFVVLWLCNLFMKVNELTLIARITMYKIRITMPLMIGITVMLFAMVSFISRDEKRINKEIEKEKRSHTSSITNANMFGLVDDDWDKGFLSIYGEEIKPGKDHGTAYMVFKFLSVLSLSATAFMVLGMLCMMLSATR